MPDIIVLIAAKMNVKDAMKRFAQDVFSNVRVRLVIKYYAQSAMILKVRRMCVIAMNALADPARIVECDNFVSGKRVAQNASDESLSDCMKNWNS